MFLIEHIESYLSTELFYYKFVDKFLLSRIIRRERMILLETFH